MDFLADIQRAAAYRQSEVIRDAIDAFTPKGIAWSILRSSRAVTRT